MVGYHETDGKLELGNFFLLFIANQFRKPRE